MPRTARRFNSVEEEVSFTVPMTEELATLAAAMSEAHKTNKIPTYQSTISNFSRQFGTAPERGGCDCAQCLRKSGPDVSDLRETIDQIADLLAQDGVDATDQPQAPADSRITAQNDSNLPASQQLAEKICQHALEQPDPDQLQQLFDKLDGDLNQDEEKRTAAEIADILALPVAQRGHANIIDVLADQGADFVREDFARGGPPLMHAANNGHAATVSALLRRGADINAADRLGQTALMVAVFSDRHQAAEVLIKEGEADLDAEDSMGRTALSHAAKYGSVDCMNLLANCHADIFHKDHDGKTPVQIAEGNGNARTETVTLLKRYQQLQTIRLRCERKKQRELTLPSQLTPEEQAQAQAKSDAIAEALMAQEAAEKEKALTRKVKKKSKPKETPMPSLQNGIHAVTDSASQPSESEISSKLARETPAESNHINGSALQSDQTDALQAADEADATCIITVQSNHDNSLNSEPKTEHLLDKHTLSNGSSEHTVSAPTHPVDPPSAPASLPLAQRSTSPTPSNPTESSAVPSSQPQEPVRAHAASQRTAAAASSGMHPALPAVHVSTVEPAVQDSNATASSEPAADTAASSAPLSRAPSPAPAARRPQSASTQQVFASQLKAALGPTARKVQLPAKPVPRARSAPSVAPPAEQDVTSIPSNGESHQGGTATSTAGAAATPAISAMPVTSDTLPTTAETSAPATSSAPAAAAVTASVVALPLAISAPAQAPAASAASSTSTAAAPLAEAAPDVADDDAAPYPVADHMPSHDTITDATAVEADETAEADAVQGGEAETEDKQASSTAFDEQNTKSADTTAPASIATARGTSQADVSGKAVLLSPAASTESERDSHTSSPVTTAPSSPSRLPSEPSDYTWAALYTNADGMHTSLSDHDGYNSAEQSSPHATAPVRKPPGLPSPVPATKDHAESESAAVNGSPTWVQQGQSEASTTSHSPPASPAPSPPHSPVEAPARSPQHPPAASPTPAPVAIPAYNPPQNVVPHSPSRSLAHSLTHSPDKADEVSTVSSQNGGQAAVLKDDYKRQEQSLEQKLRNELKRIRGSGQPIDPTDAALRARLEKEAQQQFQQELRHLKGKTRAAEKQALERAAKERAQQIKQEAQHAKRREAWAAAQLALEPPVSGQAASVQYSNSNAASSDGGYDADDAYAYSAQSSQAYPAARPRHMPAHERQQRPAGYAAAHEGSVPVRGARNLPYSQAPTQERPRPYAPPATNPLAFLGQVAPAAAPKANPDPLAFGVGFASGAVYKQQVDRLAPMIEASRSRPHHEQERLQQELQSLVTKASRDRCPLPQAEALLHDLKSAQETRDLLQKALNAQPISTRTLEHAIQAGRNCRLLNKDLVKDADTQLRDLKRTQHPQPQARQQYATPLAPAQVRPPQSRLHTRPAYAPQHPPSQAAASQQQPKHATAPQYIPQKPQFVPRPYTPQEAPVPPPRYMPAPAAPQQRPLRQEYMPAHPPAPQQQPPRHEYMPAQPPASQQTNPRRDHMSAQHAAPQQQAPSKHQPQPLTAKQHVPPQYNPQQVASQQAPPPQYKPQQAPARPNPPPYMPPQAPAHQNLPPQHVPLQPVAAPRVLQRQPAAQPAVADAAQTSGYASQAEAVSGTDVAPAASMAEPSRTAPAANPLQGRLPVGQAAKGPPPGMPVRKGPHMVPPSDAQAAAAAAMDNLEPALARAAAPVSVKPQPLPSQNAPVRKSPAQEGKQDECVVCWAHEKDVVCIPCGHVAMCKDCSQAVLKKNGLCPVCRTQIREVFQLYRT